MGAVLFNYGRFVRSPGLLTKVPCRREAEKKTRGKKTLLFGRPMVAKQSISCIREALMG
jgi:hypothetical protein